jgi:hypothetical protein
MRAGKSKVHKFKELRSSFIDTSDTDESGTELLLWPTRIYIAKSPQPWIPAVLNLIHNTDRSFQADWYNKDFLKWPYPEIQLFKDFLRPHVHRVIENLHDWGWAAWVNVTPDATSWHNAHVHDNTSYSFVYYLAAPPIELNLQDAKRGSNKGGVIELTDPRGAAPYMYRNGESPLGMQLRIQPEAGMLIIFPAYLMHSVAPLGVDSARVSIAGNIANLSFKQP